MGNDQTSTNASGKSAMGEVLQISGVLAALAASSTEVYEAGNYYHATVPQGYKIEDLSSAIEKMQDMPRRKRGTVQVKDIDSLLLYCADQNTPNADGEIGAAAQGYIYADPDTRKVVAVFNDQRSELPGWRDHRAEFKTEFTPEFHTWLSNNKKHMSQGEFAEFIEDNMADITEPAATSMLEIATTIQAKTDINFSSSKHLQNGQVQLGYTENIDARAGANGALQIPKIFTLGMRVFKNGEGYKLQARLKFRLNSGTVKFWYELDRPERVIEAAFQGYTDTLREKSGYTVLLGTP